MAKPLRIGSIIDVDRPLSDTVAQLQRFADAGLDHAFAVADLRPGRPDSPRCSRLTGAWHRARHRCRSRLPAPPDDVGAAGVDGAVGHGQPASPRHRALAPGGRREHVGHELRQGPRAI